EVRRSLWWPCASLRCAATHDDRALRNWFPVPFGIVSWSAAPVLPLQCVEPVRRIGPCPGEDGKSPGRTSPCGGADYVLDWADIARISGRARPRQTKMSPARSQSPV